MIDFFDEISFESSEIVTKKYSTSFSLGIKTLDKRIRKYVYAIYAFARCADEIVDTFYTYDQPRLLANFERDTYEAIANKMSVNPILHSFQITFNKYNIDHQEVVSFFNSMRMDLSEKKYNTDLYEKYINGSAEVIGLMCLRIFVADDLGTFNKLKESAMYLGAAFQKVNFLRDIKDDYIHRGRVYFPYIDFSTFNQKVKCSIEKDIEKDFKQAYQGIIQLPNTSRRAVLLAYNYYYRLFTKIRKISSNKLLKGKRVRLNKFRKIFIWIRVMFIRIK